MLRYLEDLVGDLRCGLRQLRRAPGFAFTAMLTLALGIGANTAIYSAVDAAFFRPLPFPTPDRLVRVSRMGVPFALKAPEPKTLPDVTDLYGIRDTFTRSAVYATGGFNLGSGAEPVRVNATFVTTEFFETVGRQPLIGRTFAAEEESPGGPAAAMLSHRLWLSQFGGDPAIVGRPIVVSGVSHTVVGVMPPDFRFPSSAQLWLPLPVPAPEAIVSAFRNFLPAVTIARLAPGVTPEVAADRVRVLRASYATTRSQGADEEIVTPLQQVLIGDRRTPLLVLLASAGLLLLLACVNVANLLLSRGVARRHELAVRAALGAGRGRLMRQLLAENLLLALSGAAVALALAQAVVPVLAALTPPALGGLSVPQVDSRILIFTLVIAVTSGLVFGLWPAVHSSSSHVGEALKSGGAAGSGPRSKRLAGALVVAEAALASMLLVGAGLMVESLLALLATDTGLQVDSVATARLNLPAVLYPDSQSLARFSEDVLARLREAPGVRSAAAINTLPLAREEGILIRVAAEGSAAELTRPFVPYLLVSPGYFQTMGVPLLRGRDFSWNDGQAQPVGVVSRSLAQALWPGEDALGKRFTMFGQALLVVGIVADARFQDRATAAGPQAYLPIQNQPQSYTSIVVRTTPQADASAGIARIRAAVAAVDPRLPIYAAQSLEDVIAETEAPRRTNTWLIALFGVLALGLAGVGLYGVLAHSVAQRTREIGLRLALGAAPGDVLAMIVRQGLAYTTAGVLPGLAGAVVLSRFVESLLYGVSARDPIVYVLAAATLLGVALLAAWIPARRASAVDPMTALRTE